jgi:hypothetical protein
LLESRPSFSGGFLLSLLDKLFFLAHFSRNFSVLTQSMGYWAIASMVSGTMFNRVLKYSKRYIALELSLMKSGKV